mgnify:CR=1 FL=1
MLIVNDDQLRLAGILSLEKQCYYCKKVLAAYPLIMGDDAKQTVYHVACALELATDLMVDLYTFFSPPAPYPPLFVLTVPNAASARMLRGEQVQTEGVTHAVNQHEADQKGALESSLPGQYPRSVSDGSSGRREAKKRADPCVDSRLGPLVQR